MTLTDFSLILWEAKDPKEAHLKTAQDHLQSRVFAWNFVIVITNASEFLIAFQDIPSTFTLNPSFIHTAITHWWSLTTCVASFAPGETDVWANMRQKPFWPTPNILYIYTRQCECTVLPRTTTGMDRANPWVIGEAARSSELQSPRVSHCVHRCPLLAGKAQFKSEISFHCYADGAQVYRSPSDISASGIYCWIKPHFLQFTDSNTFQMQTSNPIIRPQ